MTDMSNRGHTDKRQIINSNTAKEELKLVQIPRIYST